MNRSEDISGLIEQFLWELDGDHHWITVREIRGRFGLTRNQAKNISVFLKRLSYKPFCDYPFIVCRIERVRGQSRSETTTLRYLVRRR